MADGQEDYSDVSFVGAAPPYCSAGTSITGGNDHETEVVTEYKSPNIGIGTAFSSLESLLQCIEEYQKANNVKFYRRDSRTIANMKGRCPKRPYNDNLKYAELHYCCRFGGKGFNSKSSGARESSSLRQGCEMHIRFGVSDDGSQLVVKSMSEEHNHEISEETVLKEALHPELGSYISKLVWNDMHITADEVQRKLKAYVINEMFKDQTAPPHTRRQYFPTKKQIRYFMAKARVSMNITKESEVKLEAHAEKLREVHKDEKMIFNFRVKNNQGNLTLKHDETNELEDQVILSSTVNTSNDVTHEEDMENATILFCHQTPHQQRMLKRYGVQVVLTKINDIHSKIPFPLYAVYVQTNVDYQLIAEFILQKNDNVMIAEALNTVKDWNPGWSPKFVVADNCEEQLTAVETCFPGSFILISDDAREKAWEEWLSSPANHLKDYKDEIVKHLQAIANSFSEDMLNVAAHELEDSETWKMSDHFRNWFQSNWLSQAKRWVKGYRPDDYIALNHTERLLEDEIRTFKGIKIINKANPLQDVIQHVVEHIVPAAKKQYETYNQESSRLQRELFYSYDDMPRYLTCRPGLLSRHIYERLRIAKSESFTITCLHPGIFTVQGMGNDDDILHTVSFGDITSYPSCDCADWLYHKLPCLHFAAVFNNYKSWNWDMLCASYKANPAFSIDWSVDGVVDNISEGRTDRSIQTTETLGTKSINSVGSSNSKVSLPEFRRFPETPQMLASQCRNLLQQLGKLQLAHQTRENLYHLKCELKELLSMLSKKSSSGVTIPYITSPKTERKVKSQLSDSSLSVFEQFNVKPVTPKEVVLGIRNPGALQRSNYSSNIQVTPGQGGYSNLKNTTEGNKIKVFRKRVGETDQSQIPSKTQVMDSNTLNDSDGVSSSFDVRESKEKTSLEESRSTENCEPAVVFISQFSDSEDFERTPVPIVLERSVAEDDVTSSVTASVTAQVSQPDSNSGEVPLIDAPARSENNLSTISSSNGSSSNTMIISNNIGSSSDTIIK